MYQSGYTEFNQERESMFFTINIPVVAQGRLLKVGQQFKWLKRTWLSLCCGNGQWEYTLDRQINDCVIDPNVVVADAYGALDSFIRPWASLSHSEEINGDTKNFFAQPGEKDDNPLWYDKDGYLKPML
jgi:hypothetical protein